MRRYLTESLGSFFLVLTYGLAYGAMTPLAPLVTGAMLMGLIYMAAPLSGGHFNPAVTLAARIRGWVSWREAGWYLLAQLGGALAGAALVPVLVLDDAYIFRLTPDPIIPVLQALLMEVLFTFVLVLVMLTLSGGPGLRGHAALGLSTGLLYMAALLVGKAVSGGAFNPLLGLAPNLLSQTFMPMWLYVAGPLLGGALAGFTAHYLLQSGPRSAPTTPDPS